MAKYRLSPAAESDLEGIWLYTRKTWGIAQAERYTDMLVTAFERIAGDPMHAPACDHIRRGYRRAIAESHVIYFRVTDMGIDVIRVLHERMDAPRHL